MIVNVVFTKFAKESTPIMSSVKLYLVSVTGGQPVKVKDSWSK